MKDSFRMYLYAVPPELEDYFDFNAFGEHIAEEC